MKQKSCPEQLGALYANIMMISANSYQFCIFNDRKVPHRFLAGCFTSLGHPALTRKAVKPCDKTEANGKIQIWENNKKSFLTAITLEPEGLERSSLQFGKAFSVENTW